MTGVPDDGGAARNAAAALTRVSAAALTRRGLLLPDVRPPGTVITGSAAAPGYVFVGPETGGNRLRTGPLIIDQYGEPVYFNPVPGERWATNFRAQSYQGKRAPSWWQGYVIPPGFGDGEGVVVDSSYRELARIRAGNGRTIDLHALRLTPQGTALFTCQPRIVSADLSSVGGSKNGHAYESIMQEVDVHTGRLLMEWRSLEHIPVSESYRPPTPTTTCISTRSTSRRMAGAQAKCSSSPSSSPTGRSQVGHHQRASIGVPQTAWRGAAEPSALRAPQPDSSLKAPASSRPAALSS